MVQLSAKVTLTRIPDMSYMCTRRVLHVFRMHPKLIPDGGEKGRGSYVSLVAALSQIFALAWMCIEHVPDASCTCSGHV